MKEKNRYIQMGYIALFAFLSLIITWSCNSDLDPFGSDEYFTRADLTISSRMEPPSPPSWTIIPGGTAIITVRDSVVFQITFSWNNIEPEDRDATITITDTTLLSYPPNIFFHHFIGANAKYIPNNQTFRIETTYQYQRAIDGTDQWGEKQTRKVTQSYIPEKE